MSNITPIAPVGIETEPVLLVDKSGSMNYAAAHGANISRWGVVTEAMATIVASLGAADSQAEAEAAAGEDAGGLMTVVFSDEAEEVGDLNPANWQEKWSRFHPGGGTKIMPGWQLVVEDYLEEFGDKAEEDRPALVLLVVTDGEAEDMAQFEAECAKAHGHTYVAVAVVGYGADHDNTVAAYQKIAANNNHVQVYDFGSATDPNQFAEGLLALVG
jgi:uncharacterized protein YegL